MIRRELLGVAIGSASLAMGLSKALAEEHMDHMQHMDESALLANPKLAAAARRCVAAGEACMSHCLGLFAMGNTSVANCAKTAYQHNAVVAALARLASANSEHLSAMAKLAYAICLDCEKECRKHENEHAVCKACADSCAATAEECKKYFS